MARRTTKATAEEVKAEPGVEASPAMPEPEAKHEQPKAQTPWTNFTEAKNDLAKQLEQAQAALTGRANDPAALVLAPGCSKYICRRNCGSGKYRKGMMYALPDPQPAELFRKVEK